MRKLFFTIIMIFALTRTVFAAEFTAPPVPDSGSHYMPDQSESFMDGLWYVIRSAMTELRPEFMRASGTCVSVIALVMIQSVFYGFAERSRRITDIGSTVGIGVLLLQPTHSLIRLSTTAVTELSEYGKLLIPVLAAATAAQGGVNSSNALFTVTTVFASVLSNLIGKLIVPLIYIFLCLAIANRAIGENLLKKMSDFVKWIMTWALKISIYAFTGFTSVTGVISGSTDVSVLKATKIAISGSVPVIGNILSDASETILVSVGLMKSAVGIYGIWAIIATWISPFLKIGVQYLLLKATSAVCGVYGTKNACGMLQDFTTAMGLILASVSTISLLLLISVVCFMKGVAG